MVVDFLLLCECLWCINLIDWNLGIVKCFILFCVVFMLFVVGYMDVCDIYEVGLLCVFCVVDGFVCIGMVYFFIFM